eukprot:9256715-Alexandrium_andersonii.AAC.1
MSVDSPPHRADGVTPQRPKTAATIADGRFPPRGPRGPPCWGAGPAGRGARVARGARCAAPRPPGPGVLPPPAHPAR